MTRDKNSEKKKTYKRSVLSGIAHISSSFNNTLINITDLNGNTLVWGSAGHQGFKGAKKSTPYAAQVTAESLAKKAIEMGMRSVSVRMKGAGSGREAVVRALMGAGLVVSVIKDVSPVAHNGCKPPKRRRV